MYDRIKKRRIELKMSQEELAHKVGYESRSAINKIELGKRNIRQDQVEKFAEALNTTSAFLQGHTNNPDIPQIDLYKIMRRAEELRAKYDHGEKWMNRFREALSHTLETSDSDDLRECFIDINQLYDIASGDLPVSFDDACSIADALGLSLDEMVGRKSYSVDADDERIREFIGLFSQLTTDQQTIVISQIKGILAN